MMQHVTLHASNGGPHETGAWGILGDRCKDKIAVFLCGDWTLSTLACVSKEFVPIIGEAHLECLDLCVGADLIATLETLTQFVEAGHQRTIDAVLRVMKGADDILIQRAVWVLEELSDKGNAKVINAVLDCLKPSDKKGKGRRRRNDEDPEDSDYDYMPAWEAEEESDRVCRCADAALKAALKGPAGCFLPGPRKFLFDFEECNRVWSPGFEGVSKYYCDCGHFCFVADGGLALLYTDSEKVGDCEKDGEFRVAAVKALGQIAATGETQVVRVLMQCLEDGAFGVRVAAVETLRQFVGKNNADLVGALLNRMFDGYRHDSVHCGPKERLAIVMALGAFAENGDARVTAEMIHRLLDRSYEVRGAALCILSHRLTSNEISVIKGVIASTSCNNTDAIRGRFRAVREALTAMQIAEHPNAQPAPETAPMEPCGGPNLLPEPDASAAVIDLLPEPGSPVAVIDPVEASEVCEQQWASAVELLASGGTVTAPAHGNLRVVLLVFNRDQRAFDDVLLNSEPAARARASGCDLQPPWAKGAKIFVADIKEEHVQEIRVPLQPRHVVAYEEDLPEILSALEVLPSHIRPRLKPANSIVDVPFQGDLSMFRELTAFTSSCELTASTISNSPANENASRSPVVQQLPPVRWTFIHFDVKDDADSPKTSRSV